MSTGINDHNKSARGDLLRQRLVVTGVVQGVGFRPFVYGLALKHDLVGFVGNDSQGVFIEIEGHAASVAEFQVELVSQSPPLAYIDSVTAETVAVLGALSFEITHSKVKSTANTLVSPDICICDDCLNEFYDSNNRRYGYPFINCTNCGPRFSIIKDIPYDRPLTTMADFEMCADCQEEYENPLDRRFHAQPNACPVCGPHVWLEFAGRTQNELQNKVPPTGSSYRAILGARELLADGKIVAVKGLGGFHLACNASDDKALQTLRERKGRIDKPFAVMALDIETVREFADLTLTEEEYLLSKERPILLVRKKLESKLSLLVAPGNQYVGVMLPYTPLHYLLIQELSVIKQQTAGDDCDSPVARRQLTDLRVLVMTSGNHSDEPIVKDNEKARVRLAGIADAFLFHNRDIYARCDDSVIRILGGTHQLEESAAREQPDSDKERVLLPVRRSRGYAPFPVKLPFEIAPTLAVGGELKGTFCLAKAQYAYMSQHIGDMANLETLQAFEEAVQHFQYIFRTDPQRIACDLHPGYLSSRWAREMAHERQVVQIQHHHAHIASVMAEHRLDGSHPVIGFSFDGTGYGTDGAVWGGEVLIADYREFERVSFLKYVPLVGGDVAVKRPFRMALSHLWAAGIEWGDRIPSVRACSTIEQRVIAKQLEKGINSVPTSSMGRLFDAVASLAGVGQTITYEAQAAIEFESLATPGYHGSYAFVVGDGVFDAGPVIEAVVQDVLSGAAAGVISARFHAAVANLILSLSNDLRATTGIVAVALSGGVFQNVTLLAQTVRLLRASGYRVYHHRLVPPNDGGLALGQAIIAAVSS